MIRYKSQALFEEGQKYIPGGVNSPVRAFKSVGMPPVFIEKAKGARLWDVDGNEYLDYICSWGPMILGHDSEVVLKDVEEWLHAGTSYGVPSPVEIEMAKAVQDAFPSMELLRMVNSGTEATMSALRVARGFTNREKIIKFEGCYHGHGDALLVKSGSGTLTFGVPTSAGVTKGTAKDTLVATYNDIESVKKLFEENKNEIAAVILEPVAGNMGVVLPTDSFANELRKLTKEEGALLIFDEVITGFRVSYGGAQSLFGIEPDLTCLGKIIGGGLPVGAYGGKKEIMEMVAPLGGVYQAGTLSGNPLAMKMGLNTLTFLKENPDVYDYIEELAIMMQEGFEKNIAEIGIKAQVNRYKGMVCLFFTEEAVDSYEKVMTADTEMYAKYFKGMIDRGVLLAPAQFEGIFISAAHTKEDIQKTIDIQKEIFETLVQEQK